MLGDIVEEQIIESIPVSGEIYEATHTLIYLGSLTHSFTGCEIKSE